MYCCFLFMTCTLFATLGCSLPQLLKEGFGRLERRISEASAQAPLTKDLGYAVYEGYKDPTTETNTWKGIRYAAAPIGALRWQPPQKPASNRSAVIKAFDFAPNCPQSKSSPYMGEHCVITKGATTLPAECLDSPYFQEHIKGGEDCLFLNVYSPPNAKDLPVLVLILGGGYGSGNARQDPCQLMLHNQMGFVTVTIAYRIGAFGFLSSADVKEQGTVNAGLLDQHFALQWVQQYIVQFGGSPRRVTIAGESAGGGSVMLQDIAYGGSQGPSLFNNVFTASPYLPLQWNYSASTPSQNYFDFARMAGCGINDTFECLVNRDTYILQQASALVSAQGRIRTWSFVPVTDGRFIEALPTQLLGHMRVNGLRALSGNSANEGAPFVPQNIVTEQDFLNWLQLAFANFDENIILKVLDLYPSTSLPADPTASLYATNGVTGPTALNQSSVATGQQQRANNVYAESTFVCPSYWIAQAHAGPQRAAYKYQFSVPPALHADDKQAYLGLQEDVFSIDFEKAFMRKSGKSVDQRGGAYRRLVEIVGNFVRFDNPSISNLFANGYSTGNRSENAASAWPRFTAATPNMLNLNETGGTPSIKTVMSANIPAPDTVSPGLKMALSVENALIWEGGRGVRCQFWMTMGGLVPE